MQRSILIPFPLLIRYDGDTAAPTFAFDADGGTSAGQLTLVDDDNGTTAIDLGDSDNDTLDELISTINAVDDWHAYKTIGADGSMSLLTADLSRAFDDTAETIAGINKRKFPIVFAENQETIAASSTVEPSSRQAVDVQTCGLLALRFEIEGADAGASGDVLFNMQANSPDEKPRFNRDGAYAAMQMDTDGLDADAWDTILIDGEELPVALDGANSARKTFTIDVRGIDYIRLGDVTNPDDSEVKIRAWLSI